MGVLDWSVVPAQNAITDPAIPARDGASAREFPGQSRGIMAGVAALAADQGGALVSTGTDNAYVVATLSGVTTPQAGTTISFWADRDNTASPSLNIDGTGPRQWLNGDGVPLPAGSIRKGVLYTVAWSSALVGSAPAWRLVSGGKQIAAVSDVPGLPTALSGKASLGHTAAPDADYQALVTDVQIGFPVLTAARTVYFPDVDTYPLGQDFVVADESMQCSPDRPIIMAPGPGTNDQIGDGTPIAITAPNQGLRFRRGRANLWILV
ncbi:hypothetical protein [Methylobacterium gossipiicola]|uniref:Uncharacterized protein n=1 Tax=Methylobacterium gossipiicola TaxID=582675 RepID=A0A1I2TN51_9HYPH|nr:hypothetical protein [Methylobacterium gossipiicola]SFG64767.1 hypothetical protein SAMN05192565_107135 [Methylobacterium gossipiicola]